MKSKTKYFDIETLSVALYDKIVSNGDASLLLINPDNYKDSLVPEIEKAWNNIQDEIIKITGKNEAYISYLRHKIDYIKHKNNAINGDKWSNTLASIAEIEVKSALDEMPQGESIMKTLLRLSKIQGYHLKATEITVKEYFTLIKMHSNDSN